MPNYSVELDAVLRALADPTRRAVVERLATSPAVVSDLLAPFAMTLPWLLQHLRILEQAQLVATEKVGRVRTCRLETRGLTALRQWAEDRRSTWDKRLDRLAAMFEEKG